MSQAVPRKSQPKKSGGNSFWIIFLLIVLGGVAASEFAGPAKGWMGIAAKPQPQAAQAPAEIPKIEKTPEPTQEIKPDAAPAPPEPPPPLQAVKSRAETLFDRYLEEELAKLPKPIFGKAMTIHFKTGDPQELIPLEVETAKERLVLKSQYGRMSPHYSNLRRDSMELFFPEKKAARLARKRVSAELSARLAPPAPPPAAVPASVATASNPATPSASNWLPKFDAFIPIACASPEHLKHPQLEVQNWIDVQSRRSHTPLAENLYCKQQGPAAVLYIEVSSSFAAKGMEERMQLAEAFRQFWSLRCMSNGVAPDDQAFVCLVSQGKVVGGSQMKDAADVWVKK
ncbi:MAG: hypothetical protein RL095_3214 [Verrucomicrobiota bacterium]|jgi:hypothetical protein